MTAAPPTPVRALPVADHEVARRVLRWLAVAGIVIGIAELATATLTLLGWGYSATAFGPTVTLRVLYRVAVTLSFVSPTLLIAGALGLLKDEPWARPALTTYAFVQIAGSIVILAHGIVWRQDVVPNWTAMQHVMSIASGITNAFLHCLLPAAVIFCLVRPGLLPYASPPGTAFQVLPAEAEPIAAASPAES